MTEKVTFWFDVACPFAWMTSRWILEVEKVRDIEVEWEPMSLAILNDHPGATEDHQRSMAALYGPARVAAEICAKEPGKLGDFYTAMGTKIHVDRRGGRKDAGGYNDLIAEALKETNLEASYLDAVESKEAQAALESYHQEALDKVGDDVGTPVVQFRDSAFFGPVITRLPEGEEAGKLFDAAVTLASFPYFFELKRSRTEMPQI